MNANAYRKRSRFSLVELLLIVAIIGLLAVIAARANPAYEPLPAIDYNHTSLAEQHREAVQYAQLAAPSVATPPGTGDIVVPPLPTGTPPTPGNFLQSTISYFSSFTGLQTFQTNDTFDIWTGAEYVNNQNTAATLGISWNFWHPAIATIGVESVTRNAGVAGVILSQGAGFNVQKAYKDVKLVGFIEGEKDFVLGKYVAEIGFRIFKALTDNTYGGIGISERLFGGRAVSNMPTISVLAGTKF